MRARFAQRVFILLLVFGLLPMALARGTHGPTAGWRRPIWAVLFGLSVFAFIHILIGPDAGYLSDLSTSALMAAFGVFALFGAVSVLFWAYFRFRPSRPEPATPAEG